MNKVCSGWCLPTIIYLVLSVIGIVLSLLNPMNGLSNKINTFLTQVVITALWTGLMYWLCKKCRTGWSWFVLLFPVLFGLGILFVAFVLLGSLPTQQLLTLRRP